ncbi:GH1 family beta-glucosidase [Pedobacter sp. SYSU D00535]|uniref:GH1 family beta-glucosidase n=1 Tax=Pedobacter sp. SYSU D00535 TaxID=2810308 RepID=UPI001A958EFE|nr:GH1 family beta-glucosidase [Pedobacter sp. SYSU D00535]
MINDSNSDRLAREQFGRDFKWGVSTAAYQIEGAHDVDGKGLSIWDVFTSRKGKVKKGQHGNVACDFYNCFKGDIQLVQDLGIPNFRFSISWSRVLPTGTNTVNQKGIDYYNRIIDYCLESGIEPWVTLYHWDLPQELELKGGWTNREVVDWFSEYAALCVKSFGDRVTNWMVMNEPAVFTGAGYFFGIHAPGRTGMKNFLPAIHHATLSMAAGGKVVKQLAPQANVGTTFSCSYVEPATSGARDLAAAKRADALLNRLFLEPILGLGYPVDDLPVLKKLEKYMRSGDEERMSFDFDFIGIQNYTREIVTSSFFTPYIGARLVAAKKRKVPLTEMGWEVYPEAIYQMIKKFNSYSNIKKLIITENGAAFPDILKDGRVADEKRKKYIEENLRQVLRAQKEGFSVDGYFVWTLTDNFEWAEGYHPRFGLIYVDFETQQRVVKDSGLWYKALLQQ